MGTLRIAHFSDLHFGPKNLVEADRCFGAAIEQAIAADAEVAVISGDATDHALDLHAPAAQCLMAHVRRLADHCPVLMLQGTYSHEPPGTLAPFRLLGGRWPVHVAERIEQVALTNDGQWIASHAWQFDVLPTRARGLVSCVPTVNKSTVAAVLGASAAARATGEQLAALLSGFAPSHRAARQRGVPTLLVSHGTVFGCTTEHGVPMAGFDHEFTTGNLFAAEAQAVLLGHIHQHQAWVREGDAGLQYIAYAGSIGRFHHGEVGEKGFLLWEVSESTAHARLNVTPARRTRDLVFQGRPDVQALRAAAAGGALSGVHVRVRWTVADEDRHAVDRAALQAALADAETVQLEGRIVPVVRSRAAGVSRLPSLHEQIKAWAVLTEANADVLLDCLDQLHAYAGEDIANQVLATDLKTSIDIAD
jgi:exonuclease SbcD